MKILGLALAATPMVLIAGIVIITLIGAFDIPLFSALDNAITKIQLSGYWWTMLIPAFFLSLMYFLYKPKISRKRETKKVLNGLILYWQEQRAKQNTPQPSEEEIEAVREMFLERLKVWAWSDTELWKKRFPFEKYSKNLFGIVDNFMKYWKKIENGLEPQKINTTDN